jgi:hypothetical protein
MDAGEATPVVYVLFFSLMEWEPLYGSLGRIIFEAHPFTSQLYYQNVSLFSQKKTTFHVGRPIVCSPFHRCCRQTHRTGPSAPYPHVCLLLGPIPINTKVL